MSKKTQRLLSLFLAVTMGVSVFIVGAGASPEVTTEPMFEVYNSLESDDTIYPTIILPGISQSISYLADENGEPVLNADGNELSGGLLFIDTAGLVGKILKKLLLPLMVTLITQRNAMGFTDKLYELTCDLFSIQKSEPDGTTTENILTRTFDCSVGKMSKEEQDAFFRQIPVRELADEIGAENLYLFAFPLLGNPMDNAKNLQDYIDMVKEQCNAEKVNLAAISMGGTVLTAWADYEGADYDSINKIVNAVAVLDGTDVVGDLMERNFNLEDEYVFSEFLPLVMEASVGDSTMGYLLNLVIRILPRSVFEGILTRMTDGILETLILNAPQFWAMVPKDRYEGLRDRYLNPEEFPEKEILLAKTERFHEAQNDLHNNLTALANKGVKIYNICGYNLDFGTGDYGYFGIMGSSRETNSDAMINIESTSLGATAAPVGQRLSDEYLATADPKYISPNGGLDASTSLFKDRIWFFENQHHEVGRTDLVLELASALLVNDDIDTVDSDPRFPQFIEGRRTNQLTNAIRDAKNLIELAAKNEDGLDFKIVADKLPALQAEIDAACDFLDNTYGGGQDRVDALTESLRKLTTEAKGQTYSTGDTKTSLLQFILKKFNEKVYKYVGPYGYSDKTGYSAKQASKYGDLA